MEIVKLSPKFQIVIPKAIREGLALEAGQELQMYVLDGAIRIHSKRTVESLRGAAKGMKWKDIYRDRNDRY
ncbi:MAG TPA: AbrB/MazE/SpoVT family DNA-binding domain-containing protein [Candidatus Acidoferrum sp.]|jgi:AbrB family looped-hinge helix DNA binding protein